MSETPATRRAAIWVVIVFLLGIAAGGMLGYSYAHRSVIAANTPLPEPERRRLLWVQVTQGDVGTPHGTIGREVGRDR